MERVKEPDDLITVLIKLDRFILQNSVDHLRGLFHQVDLLGIMIKQMESSIVDGYLHFIDKFAVVEVNGLHGLGIHPVVEEKVGFGDAFLFQVTEEFIAPVPLRKQIDSSYQQQKNGCRETGIAESEPGTYLHNSCLNIKPIPGLVWISFTS